MPKTWFVGSVRSGDPSCPPLGLHCAAARLRWAVVDKLKTPWDVVSGFDRRPSAGARPCTDVEDFAWATRPGGEGGRYRMSDPSRLRPPARRGRRCGMSQIAVSWALGGGEPPRVSHFKSGMRTQNESPRLAVTDRAARDHGVVAHRELIELGVSLSGVNRWLADGYLQRLYRGVYAVGHTALTVHGRWIAAVKACGPGALLSHISAAALWNLIRSSSPIIHVTTPGRASPRDIRVHRVRRLHPDDAAVVDGVPVTSIARTLLDLADVLPQRQLIRAIEQAERLRIFDLRAVDNLTARSN